MIYLDNSATTQAFPQVAEAVAYTMTTAFGNPSSLHRRGMLAEQALEAARGRVLGLLNMPGQLVFTSGGTEANNLAIFGLLEGMYNKRGRVVLSPIEHPSVLETAGQLTARGYEVVWAEVGADGRIDADKWRRLITADTLLCSVMHMNNEVGVQQDIDMLADIMHSQAPQARFHCDGVQAAGHVDMPRVDAYSISGHKLHGPQGVGALWLAQGVRLQPRQYGGMQEKGLRAGTENLPGIVGLGVACEMWTRHKDEWQGHMRTLHRQLTQGLQALEARILSPAAGTHIVNASFPVGGEILLHALEERDIYVGTGAACTSKKRKPSHVLTAMAQQQHAAGAVRFSLCPHNTEDEIRYTLDALAQLLPVLCRYR